MNRNMDIDERILKKIDEIKLLLGMSGLEDFYDDKEIERLARLPIESSLLLITQLVICAHTTSREMREEDKEEREDKEKFQQENA
jgi:hypothetical protein